MPVTEKHQIIFTIMHISIKTSCWTAIDTENDGEFYLFFEQGWRNPPKLIEPV